MKKIASFAFALIRSIGIDDLICFGGLAIFSYGVALIYAPGGWIAAGAALFWLGIRK